MGKRNVVSRFFHAKGDKRKIAAWELDLNRILRIFEVLIALTLPDRRPFD